MNLSRLRSALAAYDAGPRIDCIQVRELRAEVIAVAREVCGPSPKPARCLLRCGDAATGRSCPCYPSSEATSLTSLALPQDVSVAAPAPEGASMPGEPAAGPSCGAGLLCLCPATSEYDPPCPRHGVVVIGRTLL